MIRRSFVKLVPRRFTPDFVISSIGSNQYTTQSGWIDAEPDAVYQDRGGVDPVSLSFSWNAATKVVTLTTTSAPNENIFIDYPLYFCTEVVTYAPDDPTAAGTDVQWEPRVKRHPSMPESASDMLNGVLATSSTSVSLENKDYGLNKYFTVYDNYKNRKASIYGQIGDTIRNLGFGYITKIKTGGDISVSVKGTTKLLEAAATLGNREQYHTLTSAQFPTLVDKSKYGDAIPVQYGNVNQVLPPYSIEQWFVTPNGAGGRRKTVPTDFRIKVEALRTSPSVYSYFCGIVDNPWSRTSDEYVNISYVTTSGGNAVYSVSSDQIGLLNTCGDYVFLDAGNTDYSISIYTIDYAALRITVTSPSSVFNRILITPCDVFALEQPYDLSGSEFQKIYRDKSDLEFFGKASFSFVATDSGQYLVYWTVTDAAEITQIDTANTTFYCILKSKPITHSSFLEKYITSTGVAIDSASFSQAQTDIDTDVQITVNDSGKVQDVHTLVESIATSVNGILYLDTETDQYKYKIVSDQFLSGVDHYIGSNDILEPDLIPRITYEDTASIISMQHPIKEVDRTVPYLSTMTVSQSDSFSRAFNSEERSKNLSHYLVDASTAASLKSETYNTPMVTYTFTVMADNFFDVDIGDIVRIENVGNRLLSITSNSVELLITARTRSVEKVKLVGYEFQKIP